MIVGPAPRRALGCTRRGTTNRSGAYSPVAIGVMTRSGLAPMHHYVVRDWQERWLNLATRLIHRGVHLATDENGHSGQIEPEN